MSDEYTSTVPKDEDIIIYCKPKDMVEDVKILWNESLRTAPYKMVWLQKDGFSKYDEEEFVRGTRLCPKCFVVCTVKETAACKNVFCLTCKKWFCLNCLRYNIEGGDHKSCCMKCLKKKNIKVVLVYAKKLDCNNFYNVDSVILVIPSNFLNNYNHRFSKASKFSPLFSINFITFF